MRRRLFLLLGAAWLLCASRVAAEPRPIPGEGPPNPPRAIRQSHRVKFYSDFDPLTVDDILSNRLTNSRDNDKFHDLKRLFDDKNLLNRLTKDKLSPEQLKFLDANSDKIAELLKDPRFLELLNDTKAARKGGISLSEEQIETLRKLADSHLDPSALSLEGGGGASSKPIGRPLAAHPQGAQGTDPEQSTADADSGSSGDGRSWWERQMDRMSRSFMDQVNDPATGEAFQQALRALGGLKSDGEGSEKLDLNGLWRSASEDAANWVSSRWEWPGKMAAASASLFQDVKLVVPEVEASVASGLAKLPGGGPGSPSDRGSGVETIALAVGVVALAVLGWQLFEKRRAAEGARAFLPGKWPVEPGSIATPADLIRAFEYLALLRLGIEARVRNHLAIAFRLGEEGGPDESRRAAAQELARLYERARYEPNPGDFGAADLAAARRDLTLLAGVAGS
jgi:hypothetical protein